MSDDGRRAPTTAGPEIGNEWWEIQEKVFTRWANTHLENRNIRLPTGSLLRGALDDGLILWQLVAEISGKEDQMEKYNRKPVMRIHKVNNILGSLNFLAKDGLKLVGIGAEDVADRKIRQILGLVWTLIFQYQVRANSDKGDSTGSAKKDLIEWLNSIGIPVKNLTSDWTDGKMLCNLVNKLRSGLISDKNITDDGLNNADQAINTAHDFFGVPKIIDASDMVEHPDEQINMTYLSYFRDKWDELRNKPTGLLIGPNPRVAFTNKPFVFQLDTVNVQGPRDIKVTVKDANGSVLFPSKNAPIKVRPAVMEGIWDVEFVPTDPGNLTCQVVVGNDAVRGCPLVINVQQSGSAKIVGPKRRTVMAEDPVEVVLQTKNINPTDLQVSIKDARGKELPNVKVNDNKDGTMTLRFTPLDEGTLSCDIKLDDAPVEGGPLTFDVEAAARASLVGPSQLRATAKKPCSFDLKVLNATPQDLHVKITDPKSKKTLTLPTKVSDNRNGTFTVTFTPEDEGKLSVDLEIKGKPVEGAPLTAIVDPTPSAKLVGSNHLKATAKKPVSFDLKVVNLKPQDLECKVRDSLRKAFPGKVDIIDKGNDTFTVKLVPQEEGELTVDLRIDGHPINGGPVKIDVEHEPWAKIRGDHGDYNATVGKPFTLTLDAVNLKPDDLQVKMKDEDGNALKGPIQVKKTDKGLNVTFTPQDAGKVIMDLSIDGSPIEGAPLSLNVDPAPSAKLIGPTHRTARAKKPFGFALEVINLKPEDLEVRIRDEKKRPFPGQVKIRDGKGTIAVGLIPEKEGELTIDLLIDGKPIGPSLTVEVEPEPWAKLVGPNQRRAVAKKPFTFNLDTVNMKPDDLKIAVTDESGKTLNLPIHVEERPDGLKVTLTPQNDGELQLDLTFENNPIEGGPLTVQVDPAPWARVIGPKNRHTTAKKPFTFDVEVINLSPEDIEVTIKNKSGQSIKPKTKITDNGDRTFTVAFVPEEESTLHVDLKVEGKTIEGAPLSVLVAPAPSAKLNGPAVRSATAKRPFTFHLDTINLEPDYLSVKVKDEAGRPFHGDIQIKPSDGGLDVTFIPEEEGQLSVDLEVDGEPVKGGHMRVDVAPEPWGKIIPPKEVFTAKKPAVITLETVNVRPEDLDIKITDDEGERIPYKVKDDGDGILSLHFVPKEGGLGVDVKLDGKPLDGGPLSMDVEPAPYAELIMPKERAVADHPFVIKGKVVNLDPRDIDISIVQSDGKKITPKVVDNNNGTFSVTFVPSKKGSVKIVAELDGEPVPGSPMTISVDAAPYAALLGPSFIKGKVNQPTIITLEATNVAPNDLEVIVKDEKGRKVPVQVKPKGDKIELSFVPQTEGKHTADINLEGAPIDGAPLTIDVDPSWGDDVLDLLASLEGDYILDRITKDADLATNRPVIFHAKPADKPSDVSNVSFTMNIRDKDRVPESSIVKGIGNGVFEMRFTPRKLGAHTIEAFLLGKHLRNSPLTLNITKEGVADSVDGDRDMKISFNVEKTTATVGEPFVFEIQYHNSDPNLISCDVKDPAFISLHSKIEPIQGSKLLVTTVPKTPGTHKVYGFYTGAPLSGGAVVFEVSPQPYAKLVGPPKRSDGQLSVAYSFQIATVNVKLNQIVCGIRGPKGKVVDTLNLDPTGRDTITADFVPDKTRPNPSGVYDGLCTLTFTPKSKGQYTCNVFLNRKQIDNGPLVLDVLTGVHQQEVSGEVKHVTESVPAVLSATTLKAPSAPRLNLSGSSDANNRTLSAQKLPSASSAVSLPGQLRSAQSVRATPVSTLGSATVRTMPVVVTAVPVRTLEPSQSSVTYVDKGQGFQMGTIDPTIVARRDSGLRKSDLPSAGAVLGTLSRTVRTGELLNVEIATKNVVESQIGVSVRDEWNKNHNAKVKQSGDNTFTITFTPQHAGSYILGIFIDDQPVSGSPVSFIALEDASVSMKIKVGLESSQPAAGAGAGRLYRSKSREDHEMIDSEGVGTRTEPRHHKNKGRPSVNAPKLDLDSLDEEEGELQRPEKDISEEEIQILSKSERPGHSKKSKSSKSSKSSSTAVKKSKSTRTKKQ